MKKAATVSAALTLMAVAYLTASVLILRPPRANLAIWFAVASAITVASVPALIGAVSPRPLPSFRMAVMTGAVVVVTIGAWMIRRTVQSSHFEGYELVLGVMLLVQGLLAVAAFMRPAQRVRP